MSGLVSFFKFSLCLIFWPLSLWGIHRGISVMAFILFCRYHFKHLFVIDYITLESHIETPMLEFDHLGTEAVIFFQVCP